MHLCFSAKVPMNQLTLTSGTFCRNETFVQIWPKVKSKTVVCEQILFWEWICGNEIKCRVHLSWSWGRKKYNHGSELQKRRKGKLYINVFCIHPSLSFLFIDVMYQHNTLSSIHVWIMKWSLIVWVSYVQSLRMDWLL